MSPKSWRRILVLGAVLVLGLSRMALTSPPPPPSPPSKEEVKVVLDQTLAPALPRATDVRWATDRSVYLGLAQEGTVEVGLDDLGTGAKIRQIIAASGKPDGFWGSSYLGVSERFLAVGSPVRSVTWLPLPRGAREEVGAGLDMIEDIDIWKNRLLALAARRDDKDRFAPEGAIAWIGSMDRGLKDFRPVLYDSSGPEVARLQACAGFGVGKVRFLPDGSFVIAPGSEPDIHLYNAQGKLTQTWDATRFGLDADCATITDEETRRMGGSYNARMAWMNRRRILEDVLPLPEGPGLIVRSFSKGRVSWRLHILQKSGGSRIYELPIAARTERDRIRADSRGRKIVVLINAGKDNWISMEIPRVVVLQLPPGANIDYQF